MAAEIWIEEWLFRGRPPSGPDSDKSPRYHVILGQQAEDPFNPGKLLRQVSDPILAENLADFGFTPSGLVTMFNTDALNRVAELEAILSQRDDEIARQNARIAALEAKLEQPARPATDPQEL